MQEFYAVQCFQCKQFQVAQKRKDRKFNCKICGNKQSVRKIAARSHKAADVRKFVQQLNLRRGQAAEQYDDVRRGSSLTSEQNHLPGTEEGAEDFTGVPIDSNTSLPTNQCYRPPPADALQPSKWTQFSSELTRSNSDFPGPSEDNAAECHEHIQYEEGVDNSFITALPDITVLRRNRRKRHARWRTPSNPPGGSDSAEPPTDSQQPRSLMGNSLNQTQPFQASKRPRTERRAERTGTGNKRTLASSRWSSWDDGGTKDSLEKTDDGIGGGLLTSLGSDEIVQEDIMF
eukprot:GFKZ01008443.1.p1 GENE.GFKZ01008443.1~~GFKZ01008443.1.p1  ORF type:complete len:288 (-),score=35.67 GFKZ01008443.1:82-945(-)